MGTGAGRVRMLSGVPQPIAGAIALMGFIITIISGDWTNMLRAAGVSVIVLLYCYPFKNAWNRAVRELAPPE